MPRTGTPPTLELGKSESRTEISVHHEQAAYKLQQDLDEDAAKVRSATLRLHAQLLAWKIIVMLHSTYVALSCSYRIAVGHPAPLTELVLDLLLDIITIVDVAVNFYAPVFDQKLGCIMADVSDVRRAYLRGWFTLDVASAIPLDFVGIALGVYFGNPSGPLWLNSHGRMTDSFHVLLLPIWRINRCLRFVRLFSLLEALLLYTQNPPPMVTARLIKMILFVLMCIHIIACGMCIMIREGVYDPSTAQWVTSFASYAENSTEYLRSHSFFDSYAVAFYFSSSQMMGYGNNQPVTDPHVVFSLFVVVCGFTLYVALIAGLAQLIAEFGRQESLFRSKLESVVDFLYASKMPKDYITEVLEYFDYMWSSGQALDTAEPLEDIPKELQDRLHIALNREMVANIALFQTGEKDMRWNMFIDAVTALLVPEHYYPGDSIVREGERGESMYFVSRGVLDVLNKEGVSVFKLKSGMFFGEVALVLDSPRTATVVASSWADVFVLQRGDFNLVAERYPEMMIGIKKAANARVQGGRPDAKKEETLQLGSTTKLPSLSESLSLELLKNVSAVQDSAELSGVRNRSATVHVKGSAKNLSEALGIVGAPVAHRRKSVFVDQLKKQASSDQITVPQRSHFSKSAIVPQVDRHEESSPVLVQPSPPSASITRDLLPMSSNDVQMTDLDGIADEDEDEYEVAPDDESADEDDDDDTGMDWLFRDDDDEEESEDSDYFDMWEEEEEEEDYDEEDDYPQEEEQEDDYASAQKVELDYVVPGVVARRRASACPPRPDMPERASDSSALQLTSSVPLSTARGSIVDLNTRDLNTKQDLGSAVISEVSSVNNSRKESADSSNVISRNSSIVRLRKPRQGVKSVTLDAQSSESLPDGGSSRGIKRNESIRGMVRNESIRGIKRNESIRGIKRNESIRGMVRNESIRGIKRNESIRGMVRNESIRGIKRNESMQGFVHNRDQNASSFRVVKAERLTRAGGPGLKRSMSRLDRSANASAANLHQSPLDRLRSVARTVGRTLAPTAADTSSAMSNVVTMALLHKRDAAVVALDAGDDVSMLDFTKSIDDKDALMTLLDSLKMEVQILEQRESATKKLMQAVLLLSPPIDTFATGPPRPVRRRSKENMRPTKEERANGSLSDLVELASDKSEALSAQASAQGRFLDGGPSLTNLDILLEAPEPCSQEMGPSLANMLDSADDTDGVWLDADV